MENEQRPPETAMVQRPQDLTPLAMLDRAVAAGAGIETLERLMALQERWQANQARQAFTAALSKVRSDLPAIVKNRTVDFKSPKGHTHYKYEDLAGLVETLSPILARNGLSFRWRTDSTQPGMVSVTNILEHAEGHAEETTLSGPYDMSGNKNPIQAVGSVVTYLQRYTLKAAIGVAAGLDDDGRQGASTGEPPTGADEAEWHDDEPVEGDSINSDRVYTAVITDMKPGKSGKRDWIKATIKTDGGVLASGFVNSQTEFKAAVENGGTMKALSEAKQRRVAVKLTVDGQYTNVAAWMPWDADYFAEQPFGDGTPPEPPPADETGSPDPMTAVCITIQELRESPAISDADKIALLKIHGKASTIRELEAYRDALKAKEQTKKA